MTVLRDGKGRYIKGSVQVFTEETKKKMSTSLKGRKLSDEQIAGMSERFKGIPLTEEHKAKLRVPKNISPEQKIAISEIRKKLRHTDEAKEKNRIASTGRKHSPEAIQKMREGQKGEKGSNWKGGIYVEQENARLSWEIRNWRNEVYGRDNFTCQKTHGWGGKLAAHHIYNFAQHKDIRYEVFNGITLSLEEHREFHKQYGLKGNNLQQIEAFIGRELPVAQRAHLVAYDVVAAINDGVA
jgi:hypothetical protein